ncbi:MAG: tetratricopeptide repeat protein, partial [Burkholderiaceae bacterium]
MPFGRKPGPANIEIDYNRVYEVLIAPAIEAAGLSAFRADQEQAAGSILPDMFQELLIADLVLADLSIANPNVWYEIGVRHALRSRGVVLLFGSPTGHKSPSAFDLYTDRKLHYSLAGDGPDPATLKQDITALTAMIKATMASWHERRISPVYYHLPNLQEPDWKTLVVGNVREIWDDHRLWEGRLQLALESGRIGDLLVLADEGPVAAFRSEAWIRAGTALRNSGQFLLALEFLGKGLAIEPGALAGLRETGICLQRLGMRGTAGHSLARARQHYRTVLKQYPRDVETWALLGRVDK